MKRTKTVLAGLTSLALIASACGSDESSDDTTDDNNDTTEETATSEAASDDGESGSDGDVTLRWRTRPDNDAEIEVYSGVSDSIDEANDGFVLDYEPGGTDTGSYQDQLITEIGNGTAPDVFWIPGTDIARFQSEGLIMDLGEMAAAEEFDTSAFYPETMYHLTFDPEAGEPGDKLWGLPRDVSTFALYLNLDLIAEAGADDPRVLASEGNWDWEAFAEVAQLVTDTGGANKGFAMDGWWAPFGSFVNAAGGGFFNEDRTECALDTPESIAGLEQATSLYDAGVTVPFGEDSESPWKAGTVGMFMNGRWATPGARSDADFNWDVVALPTGPGGTQGNWLFWGAYVVNANTDHPEEAWQLVQDLTTAETQASISELGANIPSRQSEEAIDAFLGFTPPENNQAFIDGLQDSPTAEGPLWAGSWPEYDEAMNNAVTSLFNGERTLEDFEANICSEVAGAFG
ncbi:MAG: sugar ABC transporter substrate-binding protein [Ilumatobacter sp.]|uniref:ABC transporter substrate-binding protein n=1 Tax=Ilumatobacter sp. TaxID=1967498 RepID=UPI003C76294B